ncbi:hypothetical protein G6F53_014328 [Rhizopus delemar]|nr:hypothetical protein G6F53_014328 [Rhizopus delemar]
MARSTRARVACITEGSLLITRATVFSETLAFSATSLMVALRMGFPWGWLPSIIADQALSCGRPAPWPITE